MKIGARILKTGIAIILALTIAQMLKLPSPAFAGIAAIFAIQPTIFRSYRTIIEQVQANVIGAIVAILFVILFGNHAFLVGLACIIIIIINVKLKTENTVSLSVVTVIAIMESQTGSFMEFALLRFFSIMLGILSAFVVNLFFLPPKYETKLYMNITEVTEDIYRWIRISTRNISEHTHIKGEIQNLKERILRLEQFYLMYKEDRELFKRETYAKARKLVVYRQMIATTRRLFDILRKMHKYENQFLHMSDEFQTAIRDQLDYLIVQHEQVHLKYTRRIRTSITFEKEKNKTNKELFQLVLSLQNQADEETEAYTYHMMGLVSSIIEYEEKIEHLDRLINSFQTFHKDDDEIKVLPTIEN